MVFQLFIFQFYFQIAYRTASGRFPGRLTELFLVLSDDAPSAAEPRDSWPEASNSQPLGRGQKHRLDEDQMSVESSESKRKDQSASAEKNKKSGNGKNKSKPKK